MTSGSRPHPMSRRPLWLVSLIVSGVALILAGFAVWSVTANRQLSDQELTTLSHKAMQRVTLRHVEHISETETYRVAEDEINQEITFAALREDKVPPEIDATPSIDTKGTEKYILHIAVGEVADGNGDRGVCIKITWKPRTKPATTFLATSKCKQ